LLSIPIAVRVLGREAFGVYSVVNVTLGIVALLQVGIGPALAHGLSGAKARGVAGESRHLASSAFFLTAGLAGLAGLLLLIVLSRVPLPWLFGAEFAGMEEILRPALWIGLGLFLMMFLLNLTDRIREGLLETSANNLWGAAGNLTAAAAVGIGIWFVPQVWFLVLSVYGAQVLAKLGNTAALWRRHPDVRPAWSWFRGATAKLLFRDGLAFSASALVAGMVEYYLCGFLVGHHGGPDMVALYGVLVQITILQLGFVMMLSTPTWTAVAEALARGDRAWAKGAALRLYLYGSAFGLCAFAGLVLLGPWVFPLWLGEDFKGIPRSLFACYGFYFVAHVWRHLNHAMMIGTGQVGRLARVQFAESALVAALAWPALRWGGIGGMLLVTGVTVFAVTGTHLPRQVTRGLLGRTSGS
jgi:O-antigen/teichoic acid export membrane protein